MTCSSAGAADSSAAGAAASWGAGMAAAPTLTDWICWENSTSGLGSETAGGRGSQSSDRKEEEEKKDVLVTMSGRGLEGPSLPSGSQGFMILTLIPRTP